MVSTVRPLWPLVLLFREISPQELSVCRADAKRKVVRSGISESLLPAHGQSLVPVVCCQEGNHSSDASLNEQIIIGRSDTCEPHENVAIRTLHNCHLTKIFSLPPDVATGAKESDCSTLLRELRLNSKMSLGIGGQFQWE